MSSSTKDPIDIMVLDFKQMFDSECLYECLNDVYEDGVDDDYLPLLYEANRETYVAVQTPSGISKREMVKEIVMQGDVLAPLISSLQVDTMGKECLQEGLGSHSTPWPCRRPLHHQHLRVQDQPAQQVNQCQGCHEETPVRNIQVWEASCWQIS